MIREDVVLAKAGKVPLGEVADKAARLVASHGGPLAVSLDPMGFWMLEPPESAITEEIVGVYCGDQPFTLYRSIAADMRHAWGNRNG